MVLMGSIAIIQMAKIGTELVDIAEENISLTNMVTKITELQLDQNILFERALFNAVLHHQNVAGNLEHLNEIKNELTVTTKTILQDIKDAESFVARAITVIHTEEGKAEFKHVLKVLTDVEQHYEEIGVNSLRILDTAASVSSKKLAAEAAGVEELQDSLKH